jgi:hypothetical protein
MQRKQREPRKNECCLKRARLGRRRGIPSENKGRIGGVREKHSAAAEQKVNRDPTPPAQMPKGTEKSLIHRKVSKDEQDNAPTKKLRGGDGNDRQCFTGRLGCYLLMVYLVPPERAVLIVDV